MEFIKKKSARRTVFFVGMALILGILLVPEQVSGPFSTSYPQSRVALKLKPEVLALVPVPVKKPALRAELHKQAVIKGLSATLAGFFGLETTIMEKVSIQKPSYTSRKMSGLAKEIKTKLKSGDPVVALRYFRNAPNRTKLDVIEHDKIQSAIAAGFLYDGKIESAGKLAAQSAERSGAHVPMAGWIAGLSLWQQNKYDLAAKYFQMVGNSPESSTWMASAGSFWASRAHEKAGNNRAMMIALQRAAENPRTFYGLMAVQALGQKFDFNWNAPAFDSEREAILRTSAAGARGIDLVAQGAYEAAENELLSLSGTEDPELRDALMAFAAHADLAKLSMRLGNSALKKDGTYYDVALYPVTPWAPKEGFSVDAALVHAVMRQESKFDTAARSQSGAVGLMQIMPTTARYVARNNAYQIADLKSPRANVKVGQDYLAYLLKDKNVQGDVLSLLVAYNAGPGNLAKWKTAQAGNDDPLLFIEMIPVNETREYVEHVMTNYWMYRLRDGKDVPSLRAVSRGETAQYASLNEGAYNLAMVGR